MKRVLSFVGGIALGAIVFGGCGTFLGYWLAKGDEPVVVIHNITSVSIPKLSIETDVGESYVVADLASQKSRRVKISGRDKALWISVNTSSGETLTSEKIYVSSEGIVFAIVSEKAIVIDYEL